MIDIQKIMTECKYKDKGREYPDFDCYGLVKYLYKIENGIDIIDFEYNKSNDRANEMLFKNTIKTTKWKKAAPQNGVVVVLKVNGYTSHIGFMIDDRRFLHIMGHSGVKVGNIQDIAWRNRIMGYYKYNA